MIKYVPGVGYVKETPGRTDGHSYVIGGPEYQAQKKWAAERDKKHYANVGNWEKYKDGTLDELKGLLGGDSWYYGRLANYANDVMAGDTMQYNFQFNPSSGATARAHELTNRYIALKYQGMKDSDIMGALYDTDGSLWEGHNDRNADLIQKRNRQLNPLDYLPENNPLLSGDTGFNPVIPSRPDNSGGVEGSDTGFMSGYRRKREELDSPMQSNRQSVRSLFKEMKDYENES